MPTVGIGEGAVIALSAALSLLPLLGWMGLIVWSRRIGARYSEASAWRKLWLLPIVGHTRAPSAPPSAGRPT